jgi:hypothetical protein
MIEADIQRHVAAGASAARATFVELRQALSGGALCAAEPDSSSAIRWRDNRWVKQLAVSVGKGPEWGLSLSTPVIVKFRDPRTDTRTELETWIR